MIKTILIIFLTACFFLEDIVVLVVCHQHAASCFANPVNENTSDAKEKDGEEKYDEFKIYLEQKNTFPCIANQKKNHLSRSQFYLQHIGEITTPPPDCI